jgi:hypothetical protein
MHREKKKGLREVLTAWRWTAAAGLVGSGGPAAGAVRRQGTTSSSRTTGHGLCEQRGEERWGFDGDDIQTCTGTAKRKGNNETNAMVCSPSAKNERRRRKSSPELGKMTEATPDSRD